MVYARGKNRQKRYQHIEVHYPTYLDFRQVARQNSFTYNEMLKEMIQLWKDTNGDDVNAMAID